MSDKLANLVSDKLRIIKISFAMRVVFEHQSSPFGIDLLVKEYIQPYFTSPFHFHDRYELIYIKRSFGKLYAGKTVLNFKEGDVFLFGPEFGHAFYNEKDFIKRGEKAEAIVVFFKHNLLGDEFFESEDLSDINNLLKKSSLGLTIKNGTAKMSSLFNDIKGQKGLDKLISFLKLIKEVSLHPIDDIDIINNYNSNFKITNKDSIRLEPVISYVMNNFNNELDSKEAAVLIHMSHSAFCRYFKSRTEQTFSQFVNNVRISHAASLLINKDWDILRVCYECGYKNLSYFNRMFRDCFGMNPSEYRSSIKKVNKVLMITQSDEI